MFSSFPGGLPGVGLFLLRLAVGITSILQGSYYLADPGTLTLANGLGGFLAIGSGALLLVGFLTPAAAALVTLGTLGIAVDWFPAAAPGLFAARLSAVLAAIMSLAIVFLGPGAISIDARLFGRRVIIIPPVSRPPQNRPSDSQH